MPEMYAGKMISHKASELIRSLGGTVTNVSHHYEVTFPEGTVQLPWKWATVAKASGGFRELVGTPVRTWKLPNGQGIRYSEARSERQFYVVKLKEGE